MTCKNCGSPLVYRETNDYQLDENGVFDRSNRHVRYEATVNCIECGAGHLYDIIHQSGDRETIALAVNSDPIPVTTVAMSILSGEITTIRSKQLVGLIVLDEDTQEVAQFLTHYEDTAWLEYAQALAARIPKGKWKTSYADEDAN